MWAISEPKGKQSIRPSFSPLSVSSLVG